MTQLPPLVDRAFKQDDAMASDAESDSPRDPNKSRANRQENFQGIVGGNFPALSIDAGQPSHSLDGHVRSEMESDPRKRKLPTNNLFVAKKKLKPDKSVACSSQSSPDTWRLCAEVWQHIFTFLPPRMLGRLLSINKYLHSLLNTSSDRTSTLKPEVIWQLSRRRFCPSMPTPLRGLTELQMWQLSCQRCQFCGTTDQLSPTSPFDLPNNQHKHAGPRPVWPFALRSCGPCLSKRTVKEVDLLLSSSVPSCLIPGLPFIFIDGNMQIISSAMLQTGRLNPELSVTKMFLSIHVTAIQEEFTSVRAMGEATVEEWLKGLAGRGHENRVDFLRWEKFEMLGGLTQMRQRQPSNHTAAYNLFNENFKVSAPPTFAKPREQRRESIKTPKNPTTGKNPFSISPHSSQGNIQRGKTHEESEQMKATCGVEIEKSVVKIEPQIPAHVLDLVPSFKTAVQIPSPLNDAACGRPEPRLTVQRKDADLEQHREQKSLARSQATTREPANPQGVQKPLEAKQKADKTWDDAQAPLRAQISALADHIICHSWGNARKITKKTSPRFAANVLLQVRKRFYANIRKEDASSRAAGREPLRDAVDRPFTRKLTLENMKWLFDVKVKPVTENIRKELFYCNGCESNDKLYGLEGVIQHYAAKHTDTLSHGSAVVYWRAEWPEVPPFRPNPFASVNKQAELFQQGTDKTLETKPPTLQAQPFYHEGLMPVYEHPAPPIPYEEPPVQLPHEQQHTYVPPWPEYAYPSHGQAFPDHYETLPNGHIYQELPEFPLVEPIYPASEENYQIHDFNPFHNHTSLEAHPSYPVQSSNAYYVKLGDIALNSRELWFAFAPFKDIPGSVKIFVVIHHVSTRFRTRFSEEPCLSMFMDGLSHNKDMRPVRNINGLQCKACCLKLGNTSNADMDKESYSLPQLVRHFHQRHVEQPLAVGAPVLNWCTDMIYLPWASLSKVGSLMNLDDTKLGLVLSALPEITWSSSQPGSGPTGTLDQKLSEPGHRLSAPQSSKKRPLPQQRLPRSEWKRRITDVQDNSTHSADNGLAKDARSKSRSAKPRNQRSQQKAVIDESIATPESMSLGRPKAEIASTPEPTKIIKEEEDSGEDECFDLIAGLELQLDQQASSTYPNPSG
ncbi:hypothetical protein NPX13_g4932 [Xylaria arbuscula]|uniref:DUF7892 domain-containing protein n=1 Tax=Xylaria arbuscula TaxID=114810 RepID=A0A9W8TLR9_9PEZI|nr:hypothetical protein NPX13_g4932 [Xylaria arbuscula]